jgi:hypothetical protein
MWKLLQDDIITFEKFVYIIYELILQLVAQMNL